MVGTTSKGQPMEIHGNPLMDGFGMRKITLVWKNYMM
jgi:hypothetical protein